MLLRLLCNVGWATGHEEVRLTPEFILNPPGSGGVAASSDTREELKTGDEEHLPVHPPNITLSDHQTSEHAESEHPVDEPTSDHGHKLLETASSKKVQKNDIQEDEEEEEKEKLLNPPIIPDAPKRFNLATDLGTHS